jgi:hypothetical protein
LQAWAAALNSAFSSGRRRDHSTISMAFMLASSGRPRDRRFAVPLPDALRTDEALGACIAGAAPVGEIEAMLRSAGFGEIRVAVVATSAAIVGDWLPESGLERFIASATIEAIKPGGSCCAPSCCSGEASA